MSRITLSRLCLRRPLQQSDASTSSSHSACTYFTLALCNDTKRIETANLRLARFPAFNEEQRRDYRRANRKVEVVLVEKTKHLGRASDVVQVKPGRARNHLIPLKLAKYATEENVSREAARAKETVEGENAEADQGDDEDVDADEEKKMLKLAMKMLTKGNPVTIRRATKRKTDVFNIPITKEDVVREVAKQKSVEIDVKSLMLDKPIEALGEFAVPVWVDGREHESKIKILVKKKAYK